MYFSTRKAYEVWLATASESEKQSVKSLGLDGLTSAEGLVIPAGVTSLWLGSLTSAKGLVIPAGVTWLDLNGLRSAEGLVIPAGVTSLRLPEKFRAKLKKQ